MRCQIIAECSTNHGGDLALAKDMIAAAADAGADWVKFQAYTHVNPNHKLADWLKRSRLDRGALEQLRDTCAIRGVQFLCTPMDVASLEMLKAIQGNKAVFKIASTHAAEDWWREVGPAARFIVSWPWGQQYTPRFTANVIAALTAIPLYPTPLSAVCGAKLLDGWSDHTEGTSVPLSMLAQGAKYLEVHMCVIGRGRRNVWDKAPDQIEALRLFADECEVMTTGVERSYKTLWQA